MLSNFEDKSMLHSLDLKGIKNWRKISFELYIDNGTNDLGNFPNSNWSTAEASYLI